MVKWSLMLKKLPVFIIVFILSFFVFLQVPKVSAQVLPISSPVTSPITLPVTNFAVSGKVVYKQLGRLFSNMQRVVPVQGAIVTIQNFFNKNQSFTTTTDSSGNYGINVPTGHYKVTVSDGKNSIFVPPLRIVNVKKKGATANFQGLLFPRFR